jgi:hypothetical protein
MAKLFYQFTVLLTFVFSIASLITGFLMIRTNFIHSTFYLELGMLAIYLNHKNRN